MAKKFHMYIGEKIFSYENWKIFSKKKKNYNIWQDIFCVYTYEHVAQTGATSKFASWYREEVYCKFSSKKREKKLLLLPFAMCVCSLRWKEFTSRCLLLTPHSTRIGRKYMNAHTSYECCNKFFRWSKNNFFFRMYKML